MTETLVRDRDGSLIPDPTTAPTVHAQSCRGDGYTHDGRAVLCRACRPDTCARVADLRRRRPR